MIPKLLKNKYVWTGMALLMLFLVQTYAFSPANKNTRRKTNSEKIHFTSNRLYHDVSISYDGDILIGQVRITHDGMVLTCDSAVVYENTNSFLAYGKVHMVQGDTLSLRGDSLYYDGSQEFAQVFDNVVMKHGTMTLYTDVLNYDRVENRGFYDVGGKIIDSGTTLTSQDGEYFTDSKTAHFNYNVLLVSKKDSMLTDTLHYDTRDKWAHAIGPSNILSGGSRIYTENGYYNTDSGIARLYDRPQLFNKGRQLVGDSLHYDKDRKFSEAFDHIQFYDPQNKSILCGDYGWYDEEKGEAMCTRNAVAKDFSNVNDTLYIHGDTLRLYSYNLKTDSAYRVLHSYFHVRAYKKDLQMVSDSLCFISKDSCLTLYRDPIAWSENRQILGESISIFLNDSTIDSVYVDHQALMIEQLPDSALYNQVAGTQMRAFFEEGDMREFWVDGNGTAINYPMEKDSTYLYINYIEAAKLRAYMEEKKLRTMKAFPSPQGTTYPLGLAPEEKTHLKGFAWFDWIRPKDKDDIFEWRSKGEQNKLKVQPRRNAPLQTLDRLKKKGEKALEEHADELIENAENALEDAGMEIKVETSNEDSRTGNEVPKTSNDGLGTSNEDSTETTKKQIPLPSVQA